MAYEWKCCVCGKVLKNWKYKDLVESGHPDCTNCHVTMDPVETKESNGVMCGVESIELRIGLLDAQLNGGDWRDACECVLDEFEEYSKKELRKERERLFTELAKLRTAF